MDQDNIAAHKLAYDLVADEYEERVTNLYDITNTCVELLEPHLRAGGRVLDLGCGVGLMVKILHDKGFKVEGIDLSPRMVAFSRKRNPDAPIQEGDFLQFNFSQTYAGITALAFIHLFSLEQAEHILQKIYQLLEPQGVLYIGTTKSVISSEGWEEKHDYKGLARRFRKHWTEDEFRLALKNSGFDIVEYHELTDPFGKTWMDVIGRRGSDETNEL